MKAEGVADCAMEVSSHALALGKVDDDLTFQASVFTNLTSDHMDFHKDPEGLFCGEEKTFLFYRRRCRHKS